MGKNDELKGILVSVCGVLKFCDVYRYRAPLLHTIHRTDIMNKRVRGGGQGKG